MQIVPYSQDGYNLFLMGQTTFSDIQMNGVRIDTHYCEIETRKLETEIKAQQELLYQYKEIKEWRKIYRSKFNLDSNDQLKDVLFDKLGYEAIAFTDKGKPSTDKVALEALKLPFTEDLLKYRNLIKTKDTYFASIMRETYDGWMHMFLNLNIPRTYRSSSDRVNVQNMPNRDPETGPRIRKAFITRPDHMLVEADFGSIEVKGASWNCKDPTLLSYLRNPETADMHADFMSQLFKFENYDLHHKGDKTLRKGTKNGFTFPQFYGDYYGNNAISLWNWARLSGKTAKAGDGLLLSNGKTVGQHFIDQKMKSYSKFEKHVQSVEKHMWNESFPVYKQWKIDTYEKYLRQGYLISYTGFVFQGVMGKNDAVNYPIQSIAFHCLLWCLIRLNKIMKKRKMKSKIIYQVHDSIMADVHKDEFDDYLELLKTVMCHDLKRKYDWIITPIEIEVEASEVNGNWSKMKTCLEYIN